MIKEFTRQSIYRYTADQGLTRVEDALIREESFRLYINGSYYRTITCTPSHLDELAAGYLALEGAIKSYADIKSIEIGQNDIQVYKQTEDLTHLHNQAESKILCSAEEITYLMRQHLNSSELHRLTGGVHIMSLADQGQIILTREDVGRHNAVDKIYGFTLKHNWNLSNKVFLSSGRLSQEIINKIILMGIKIVVSRAAVTDLACKAAQDAGITAIGFTRGERFNIYSHPNRIYCN